MITFFKTPRLFRWIFHRRIWGFSGSNKVYLTFDDGPTEELLPWILDFLKEENIKATFFCVGENAKNFPDLMQRMLNENHSIGNHTMHHNKGFKVSKKEYLKSIEEASKYISSNLFRPPYGRMPMSYFNKISKNYKVVMWSWLSYDYDMEKTPQLILHKATKIKGGDILVLHDNKKVENRLKEILPQLVNILREKGLEFAKIE